MAEHNRDSSPFQCERPDSEGRLSPAHEVLPGPLQESSLPSADRDVYSLKMTFEHLLSARPFYVSMITTYLFYLCVCTHMYVEPEVRVAPQKPFAFLEMVSH